MQGQIEDKDKKPPKAKDAETAESRLSQLRNNLSVAVDAHGDAAERVDEAEGALVAYIIDILKPIPDDLLERVMDGLGWEVTKVGNDEED